MTYTTPQVIAQNAEQAVYAAMCAKGFHSCGQCSKVR